MKMNVLKWLWTAWLLILGTIYVHANVSPTFAYDGLPNTTIGYDAGSIHLLNYDGRFVFSENDIQGRSAPRAFFRQAANFFAAEETAPQLALPAPTGGNPWIGEIQSSVTSEETTMYRVWGGDSGQLGGWLSPVNPGTASAARSGLALPAENTTEFISEVTVPAGTRIQTGTAGPLFGQPGGASQVLLLDRIPAANFGPGVPLPP
jgi:hypothetical protein